LIFYLGDEVSLFEQSFETVYESRRRGTVYDVVVETHRDAKEFVIGAFDETAYRNIHRMGADGNGPPRSSAEHSHRCHHDRAEASLD